MPVACFTKLVWVKQHAPCTQFWPRPDRKKFKGSLNYIDLIQFFVYLLKWRRSWRMSTSYNESVLRSYSLLYILWLPLYSGDLLMWVVPNKEGLLDSYRCTFWWYHVGCPCLWLVAGWWFGEPAARVSLSFSQHPSTTPIYSCDQDRENLEEQSKCDPIFCPGFLHGGTES